MKTLMIKLLAILICAAIMAQDLALGCPSLRLNPTSDYSWRIHPWRKKALRPAARVERESIAPLVEAVAVRQDVAGLYPLMQALLDDARPAEDHQAAIGALKAFRDKELLERRLQAIVDNIAQTKIAGNWERIGAYVNETNPDFIERYRRVTEPLFVEKMLTDYLKILNKEVAMGNPEAEALKARLLLLVERLKLPGEDPRVYALLRNNLEQLGNRDGRSYRGSPISGPPIGRFKNLDRGFWLLAGEIGRSDRGLMQDIYQRTEALIPGYVVEASIVFLNSGSSLLGQAAMARDKAYLSDAVSTLCAVDSEQGLLQPELSRKILLGKLDHPDLALSEILRIVQRRGYEGNKADLWVNKAFFEQTDNQLDEEKKIRKIARLLKAEPDFDDPEKYIVLKFDGTKKFKKSPVVAGHYCYFLGKNNAPQKRLATAQDILDFEMASKSRLAADERGPTRVNKVVAACVDFYRAHNCCLPTMAEWAEAAGVTDTAIFLNYEGEVLQQIRQAGIPLVGNNWQEMAEHSRYIPEAALKAISDMNMQIECYILPERYEVRVAEKKILGWRKYAEKLSGQAGLGKPVLLLALRRPLEGGRLELCAFCQEESGVSLQIVGEIKLSQDNNIAGLEDTGSIYIERLLARCAGRRVLNVSEDGYFSAGHSNYYGLLSMLTYSKNEAGAILAAARQRELKRVAVTLVGEYSENPYLEIEMPGRPAEIIPLNNQLLPLCLGHTEGRHSYVVYNLLETQTRLARAGDDRFEESWFINSNPEYMRVGRGVLAYEEALKVLFKNANLPYEPANLSVALEHPANSHANMREHNRRVWYALERIYGVRLKRMWTNPNRFFTIHDVWAKLFRNAGRVYVPDKIYEAEELKKVLDDPSNKVTELKRQGERALVAAAKRHKIPLLAGNTGPARDSVVAYVQSLPAITETEARSLWNAMMYGDREEASRAQAELGNRLASVVPQTVVRFGHSRELCASARTDYYIDQANLALAQMLAGNDLAYWSPESGIGLLEYVEAGIMRYLKEARLDYVHEAEPFADGKKRLSLTAGAFGDEENEPWAAYTDEAAAQRRLRQMAYEESEPDTEIEDKYERFKLEETQAIAKKLSGFLGNKLRDILKDLRIRHCAVYICGSLSREGRGYKDLSNLNLLFLTDATTAQNLELLSRLHSIIGVGIRSVDHDIEIGKLPTILIGMGDDYERHRAEGNGFIRLLEDNRLGSSYRGLATIQVCSVNGYSPRFDRPERVAVAGRLGWLAFNVTGSKLEYAGTVYEEPANGILVCSYPENAAGFLSSAVNAELVRIADNESIIEEQNRIVFSEGPLTLAKNRFVRKQAANLFRAQETKSKVSGTLPKRTRYRAVAGCI